jgi:5-formyltetrahydrofolate cyclo-ligase
MCPSRRQGSAPTTSGLARPRRGDPEPLYEQVRASVERLALDAPLGDESPLPSEAELGRRLGVSRGTLRHALDDLEAQGLLRRERGRGTFVNPAARLRRVVWQRLVPVARPDSRFDLDFSAFVPDYEGSRECAERLRGQPEYDDARLMFVAPDNNLVALRRQALADGKRLVVATFGIRRGFVLLEHVPPEHQELAATLDGLESSGRPLTLAELRASEPVDLVVTGAAAVTRSGVHFGKGHGYFDLEWGLLRELGLADPHTPVAVVVHDVQVVDDPVPHAPNDCVADLIVTPTTLLRGDPDLEKPPGLFWDRIGAAQLASIPYLAELATAG